MLQRGHILRTFQNNQIQKNHSNLHHSPPVFEFNSSEQHRRSKQETAAATSLTRRHGHQLHTRHTHAQHHAYAQQHSSHAVLVQQLTQRHRQQQHARPAEITQRDEKHGHTAQIPHDKHTHSTTAHPQKQPAQREVLSDTRYVAVTMLVRHTLLT